MKNTFNYLKVTCVTLETTRIDGYDTMWISPRFYEWKINDWFGVSEIWYVISLQDTHSYSQCTIY